MSKNKAKEELLLLYYYKCFLNGFIYEMNPLTYHHIDPVRNGGATTIDNGALLGNLEHQMFNMIEQYNRGIASDLNIGFREFKKTRNDIIRIQARLVVDSYVKSLGCVIVEQNKLLVLKRKK